MDYDIIEKILNRYGILGAFAVALSVMVFLLAWVFAFMHYPVAILTPCVIAGWMAWKVKGETDE